MKHRWHQAKGYVLGAAVGLTALLSVAPKFGRR